MHSTPFNVETDLAPIPFDPRICEMAAELKSAGLPWKPHVGCFVWDRDEYINVPSPFPERIYFILNLGRFTELLGSIDDITNKLIWIPTWYQARELINRMSRQKPAEKHVMNIDQNRNLIDEYSALYDMLLQEL